MQRQLEKKGTKRQREPLTVEELATGLAHAAASIPDNASVVTQDTENDDTRSVASTLTTPTRMELEQTGTESSASSFADIARALTTAASALPDNDSASVVSERSVVSTASRQTAASSMRMQSSSTGGGRAGVGASQGRFQDGSSYTEDKKAFEHKERKRSIAYHPSHVPTSIQGSGTGSSSQQGGWASTQTTNQDLCTWESAPRATLGYGYLDNRWSQIRQQQSSTSSSIEIKSESHSHHPPTTAFSSAAATSTLESGAGSGSGSGASSGEYKLTAADLYDRDDQGDDEEIEITDDGDWSDILQKHRIGPSVVTAASLSRELEEVASIVEGIAGPRIYPYYSYRLNTLDDHPKAHLTEPLVRGKYIQDQTQPAVRHWLATGHGVIPKTEEKLDTPPEKLDVLKNKAESIKLLEEYFCWDSFRQCGLAQKGRQLYEILYGIRSNEGMDLKTFLLTNLAVGDPFTYRKNKEINPSHFVDLAHPFIQAHLEFAPLRFSSRKHAEEQLRLKLTEEKEVETTDSTIFHLYIALGAQQVVDGYPVTFRMNLIMVVRSHIDNQYHHAQLFGLDAQHIPQLLDCHGNTLNFVTPSEMVKSLKIIANQLQEMPVTKPQDLYRIVARPVPMPAPPRAQVTQSDQEDGRPQKKRRLSPGSP